jgi:hypothetical protein
MGSYASPSHPDLITVVSGTKPFSSYAVSLVTLPPGALFTRITTATPASKAYTTVQVGRDTHVELNSDLRYVNHGCVPNLVLDMDKMEIRVAGTEDGGDGKGVKEGGALSFFYPSTEWDVRQVFECGCGAEACIGEVRGAKWLDEEVLGRCWVNKHILEIVEERKREEGKGKAARGKEENQEGTVDMTD